MTDPLLHALTLTRVESRADQPPEHADPDLDGDSHRPLARELARELARRRLIEALARRDGYQ